MTRTIYAFDILRSDGQVITFLDDTESGREEMIKLLKYNQYFHNGTPKRYIYTEEVVERPYFTTGNNNDRYNFENRCCRNI